MSFAELEWRGALENAHGTDVCFPRFLPRPGSIHCMHAPGSLPMLSFWQDCCALRRRGWTVIDNMVHHAVPLLDPRLRHDTAPQAYAATPTWPPSRPCSSACWMSRSPPTPGERYCWMHPACHCSRGGGDASVSTAYGTVQVSQMCVQAVPYCARFVFDSKCGAKRRDI